jgi:ribonucleoside-diphosphate reductase alpha chain
MIRASGHTTRVTIDGERFHLTANANADGGLGEVFLGWGSHGTTAAGLIDSYATAFSIGLRHGIPPCELIRHGLGLRFSPAGRTDDPDIPTALSIADYVARRLALDWLPRDERADLGVYTLAERLGRARAWIPAADNTASRDTAVPSITRRGVPASETAGQTRTQTRAYVAQN